MPTLLFGARPEWRFTLVDFFSPLPFPGPYGRWAVAGVRTKCRRCATRWALNGFHSPRLSADVAMARMWIGCQSWLTARGGEGGERSRNDDGGDGEAVAFCLPSTITSIAQTRIRTPFQHRTSALLVSFGAEHSRYKANDRQCLLSRQIRSLPVCESEALLSGVQGAWIYAQHDQDGIQIRS